MDLTVKGVDITEVERPLIEAFFATGIDEDKVTLSLEDKAKAYLLRLKAVWMESLKKEYSDLITADKTSADLITSIASEKDG